MERNGINKRVYFLFFSLYLFMSAYSGNKYANELKRTNGKLYICYNNSNDTILINESIVTVKLKPQYSLGNSHTPIRSNRGYWPESFKLKLQ